jgi:hypothetical protein
MTIGLATQSKAHPRAERGLDLYETPPVAVRALLKVERIPHKVWEPAASNGSIVRILEAVGHHVVAKDIATGTDFPRLQQAARRWDHHQSSLSIGCAVCCARNQALSLVSFASAPGLP